MHDDDSLEDLARRANENHEKIVEGEVAAGVEPGAFTEALNRMLDEAIDAHYTHAREALPGEAELLDRIHDVLMANRALAQVCSAMEDRVHDAPRDPAALALWERAVEYGFDSMESEKILVDALAAVPKP